MGPLDLLASDPAVPGAAARSARRYAENAAGAGSRRRTWLFRGVENRTRLLRRYASEAEAREWDEYYRYKARGALFQALDEGRATELEMAQALARLALERDKFDKPDVEDLAKPGAALAYARGAVSRRRDVRSRGRFRRRGNQRRPRETASTPRRYARYSDADGKAKDAKKDLERHRRTRDREVTARLEAYGPSSKKDPSFHHRLRELGLDLPSGAALVREAEAEHAARRREEARRLKAAAPAPARFEEAWDDAYDDDAYDDEPAVLKSTPREAPPDLTASEIAERQGRVQVEMAGIIRRDPHVRAPMHQLPADPEGIVDGAGRERPLRDLAREHTVKVDPSFPSLDSYRRTEHDVAAYRRRRRTFSSLETTPVRAAGRRPRSDAVAASQPSVRRRGRAAPPARSDAVAAAPPPSVRRRSGAARGPTP